MSYNFEGLGFSFSAKDDGFKKQTDNATRSMEKLEEVVKGVDRLAQQNKIGLITKAFELFQLNRISSGIEGLNDKMRKFGGVGTEAADSVSDVMSRVRANFVGSGEDAAKAQKMIGSNWGRAGMSLEEAQKVSADLLSVFSPTALKDSFGRYSKLIHLSGVNSSEFAQSMGLARKSMGMTEAQFDILTDQVIAVGGRTGHATEALSALPGILKEVNDRAARLNLKPDEAQQMASGVIGLSSAFFELGVPMGEASDKATKLMTTMMDAQLDINKMRVGLEGSTELVEAFAKGNVSLSDTLQLMKKDPIEAAKRLGKIRSSFDDNSGAAKRFDTIMSEQLDPSFVELFKNWSKSEKALVGVQGAMGAATGKTKEYTDAIESSGEVQQQKLNEALKIFDSRVGLIAKKSVPKLRGSIISNFGKAGDMLEKWSKKDGPLGFLTRGAVAIKEYGWMAIPSLLEGSIGSLSDSLKKFGPVGESMGGMLDKIKDKVGPVGAVAGSLLQQFSPLIPVLGAMGINFESLGRVGTKVFDKLKDWGVGKTLAIGAAIGLTYSIATNTIKVWGDKSMSTMDKVGAVGKGVAVDILQSFLGFFGVSRGQTELWVDEFVSSVKWMGKRAGSSIGEFFTDVGDWFSDLWEDAKIFGKKFVSSFVVIGKGIVSIFKDISFKKLIFGSEKEKEEERKKALETFGKVSEAEFGGILEEEKVVAKAREQREQAKRKEARRLEDEEAEEQYSFIKRQRQVDMDVVKAKNMKDETGPVYKSKPIGKIAGGVVAATGGRGIELLASAAQDLKLSSSITMASMTEMAASIKSLKERGGSQSTLVLKGEAGRLFDLEMHKSLKASGLGATI